LFRALSCSGLLGCESGGVGGKLPGDGWDDVAEKDGDPRGADEVEEQELRMQDDEVEADLFWR
jgi:hypothetical protein